MAEILKRLTTRGRWLGGLGIAATLAAGILGQRDLMRIGVLLVALPLLSLVLVSRTRYRLSSARGLRPSRASVGESATSVLRLENMSRLPSGLLLLQDQVPWQLGQPQRLVVDRMAGGSARDVSYELSAQIRGRYDVGPLQVRLVDPFGLAQTTRTFTTTDSLTVVPRVVPLAPIPLVGDWSGMGETRSRAVASTGEDDVVPREYRTGDELRRVHWKSTARSGELMVRREEQPWRTRATVLLDTRASAHRGAGAESSFEWAVAAAASAGAHLASRGYALRLLDLDAVPLRTGAHLAVDGIAASSVQAPMLEALAIVAPSARTTPGIADARTRESARDGLLVVVLADLDPAYAVSLAALRRGRATAIALIADTAAWSGRTADTSATARLEVLTTTLLSAGWRVVVCGPADDLATAWRSLVRGRGRQAAYAVQPESRS
jgi:uncharacterized protein (DUF58 family)